MKILYKHQETSDIRGSTQAHLLITLERKSLYKCFLSKIKENSLNKKEAYMQIKLKLLMQKWRLYTWCYKIEIKPKFIHLNKVFTETLPFCYAMWKATLKTVYNL